MDNHQNAQFLSAEELLAQLRNNWISPEAKAAAQAGDAVEDVRALREEDIDLERAKQERCSEERQDDGRGPEEFARDLFRALGLS